VPEVAELALSHQPLDTALADCDLAVIVTAHAELDVPAVIEGAPILVDFRGVTRGIEAPNLLRL